MDKVILIVGNNATRTGAPVLLLNLLKWIKKNAGHQFVFILQDGGELMSEYENIGPVFIWNNIRRPVIKTTLKKLVHKVRGRLLNRNDHFYTKRFIQTLNKHYAIQRVLSNTSVNGNILTEVKNAMTAKIITYVHEGERLLDVNNQNGLVSLGLNLSDEVLAVSYSVKKVLLEKFNLSKPVQVLTGAIDAEQIKIDRSMPVLEKEKVPANVIKIMACGYPVWQKGTDLFIRIAATLSRQRSDVHFIWLGGDLEDEGISQMKFDIEKLNLLERVTLIYTKPNALDYINGADIFLVLSRNESFSLVTLEAGLLKKPVLCFEDAGGPCEIVNFKEEFLVPYADTDAMCERIAQLIDKPALRSEMGDYLHERVVRNYSIEKSAGDLLEVLLGSIKA